MTTVSRNQEPRLHQAIPLLAFAFLSIYFTGVFPPSTNPNELSRIEMFVAAVDHRTFAIDATLKKYGDHEDKSVYAGHYYSNKAPGLAFAAIPAYGLYRTIGKEPVSATAAPFVVIRVLVVTSLALYAIFRLQRRLADWPFHDRSGMVAVAVAFGTPFLFFARSFFSHAWTAGLFFLAWDRVKASEEENEGSVRKVAVAGLLTGWAVLSEYPLAPLALLLGIRVAAVGSFKKSISFSAAALLPAGVLLLYNAICFGSPWSLSSSHEALATYSALAHRGLFGIGPPNGKILLASLFSLSRGAIVFSPFWVWAIFGFVAWWRSGRARADCAFAAAAVLLFVVLLSGYSNWEGGWSLGNRYLLPAALVASLGLPFALTSESSRMGFTAAAAFSVGHFFLLTCSWPYLPPSIRWPVAGVSWWAMKRNWIAPNLASLSGASAGVSLLIPAFAVLLAFAAAFWPASRVWLPRRIAATLLGLLALAGTIVVAPKVSPEDASWRTSVLSYLAGRLIQ
jgi:hypothetical protein